MNEELYSMVLETLRQASSQNPELLKPAEERLKLWKVQEGFHNYLVNILKNKNIDTTVRWLAVLCLKNGVDRYWRKQAPNGIVDSEKKVIRDMLLSDLTEPIPQIELQTAVVIAKIARFDCPVDWPELVPTLLAAVQSSDPRVQDGALITWQYVIKSLSSKRLLGDARMFQLLASDLFPFMINIYSAHMKSFMTENTDNRNLRRCLMCIKILRALLIRGFKKPEEHPEIVQFVSEIFPQISTMFQLENHKDIDKPLLDKYIINLCKVLIEFHRALPYSYIPFLKTTCQFCFTIAFSKNTMLTNNDVGGFIEKNFSNEKVIILILNLLQNIILCPEYDYLKSAYKVSYEEYSPKTSFGQLNSKPPQSEQAASIIKEFFTSDLVEHMCISLVNQFLPLTSQELLTWDDDPEAATCDEGGESYKYSLRPCVETLFLTLFHNYKSILTQPIICLLNENRNPVEPSDMNRILVKDAIYNAIGLAAFDLYDEIDFDEWFQTTLLIEMKIKATNYRIIRKRAAWLLGNWCNVKLSTSLRPLVYESLVYLMTPDEDLAVRLAACKAFKLCVDDFEFNTEQFAPYVNIYFDSLYKLLCDSKECDTKMHVLHVCSFLIERMGSAISDYANDIFESIPTLWNQSGEHNLLRCAIVTTLTRLTVAVNKVHHIVPEVIHYCTDTQQEQFLYMVEDGLELWKTILYRSPCLTLELDRLYPNLLAVLKDSGEQYISCSKIMRAYILLDPVSFYSTKVIPTVEVFQQLLPELRHEGFTTLAQVLELCLRAVPTPPLPSLHPILSLLIEFLLEDTDRHNGFKQSLLLCMLSRIILLDPAYFFHIIQLHASRYNTPEDAMFSQVLEDILSKCSLVTQPERSKIVALALCSLLTCKSMVVLNKFGKIMERVTEVLNDVMVMDENGGNNYEDSLTEISDENVYEIEPTEHEERKKKIAKFDPVFNVHMQQFVQTKLSELCSQVGAETFANLVTTIDVEIKKNLQDYISI